MNPMNYLYFTLLSIFIQFCLMDIIMKEMKFNNSIASNATASKDDAKETLKEISLKPHALYYRTSFSGVVDKIKMESNTKYDNTTLVQSSPFPMTGLMSTSFDLLYDENVTLTNDVTTEYPSSTEFDNVTEITFAEKTSTIKPPERARKPINGEKCYCDLLYQVCDINCCCDLDCTENEQHTFRNFSQVSCNDETKLWQSSQNACDRDTDSSAVEKLFCISKVNLPQKKDIPLSIVDESVITNNYKWHSIDNRRNIEKRKSQYGDIVIMARNGTFDTIGLPIPIINNYCNGNKPIRFLVNEDIYCYVKLTDLHMVKVIKRFQEPRQLAVELTNSTLMNCSSLQCANWTLIICVKGSCGAYNRELHQPICTPDYCTNIALIIEYNFYCNATGLTNATIKIYIREDSVTHEFVRQEIRVRFYMTNSSDDLVQFSGNPGYIFGLPVLKSIAENNHTKNFFNAALNESHKYIYLPKNIGGVCVINEGAHNKILFGQNKRLKCRLLWSQFIFANATDGCVKIQNRILEFLGLNNEVYISPYGNPLSVASDKHWLLLRKSDRNVIYGEYSSKDSQLLCVDMITRFAFVIVYGNNSEKLPTSNKIFNASLNYSLQNLTFNVEGRMSAVITVDISFVDASRPSEHVYAGAPKLNINLPQNFFLPFN